MRRKTNQKNLILIALVLLIALLLLQQSGVRMDPVRLINQFGITSRDLIAAAIGAGLMYVLLKQR